MDVDLPFGTDGRGRTATSDEDGHVRDLIESVLFTSPGERVNRPDFGSGLMQLVFAPNSPELAVAVQMMAQAALQRWLADRVRVESLEVTSRDATLSVVVTYTVLRTRERRTAQFTREPGGGA